MTPKLPRLPRTIEGPAGPVTVRQVQSPKATDGKAAWGIYDRMTRTILIEKRLTLWVKWHVLFHEQTHLALIDAGVDNLLTEKLNEAVCDAVAASRMRERFGLRQDPRDAE